MNKNDAIQLLGGQATKAAAAIGISPQAITSWPDELPPRIADRVFAAVVRQHPDNWQAIWSGPQARHTPTRLTTE